MDHTLEAAVTIMANTIPDMTLGGAISQLRLISRRLRRFSAGADLRTPRDVTA